VYFPQIAQMLLLMNFTDTIEKICEICVFICAICGKYMPGNTSVSADLSKKQKQLIL